MIDLGLTKIAIIGVVALIVIGPEKLPKVARMAGHLYGRAQRYLHDIKSEVSREIALEEMRELKKEVQESAQAFKHEVEHSLGHHVDESDDDAAAAAWRGHLPPRPSMSDLERKARDFRRKKLSRNSAIPGWFKQQHGVKTHIMSGAARVRKYRPRSSTSTKSFFQ